MKSYQLYKTVGLIVFAASLVNFLVPSIGLFPKLYDVSAFLFSAFCLAYADSIMLREKFNVVRSGREVMFLRVASAVTIAVFIYTLVR